MTSLTDSSCEVLLKESLPPSSEPYILSVMVENPDEPSLQDELSTIQLHVFVESLPCVSFVPEDPMVTRLAPSDSSDFVVIDLNTTYTCNDTNNGSDLEFRIVSVTYKAGKLVLPLAVKGLSPSVIVVISYLITVH